MGTLGRYLLSYRCSATLSRALPPRPLSRFPFTLNLVLSLNIWLSAITTSCNTVVTQRLLLRRNFLGNSERKRRRVNGSDTVGFQQLSSLVLSPSLPPSLSSEENHNWATRRTQGIYLLAASRSDPVRMAAIVYETCAGGLSVHEIALLILAVAIKIPIPGTANNGHC